jgi:uncharacterized protein (DUF2267 family)
MPLDEQTLIRRLQALAPFDDAAHAKRAFDATLQALRVGLTDDEADWMSVDLGPALAAPLQRQRHAGEVSLNEFYRHVGRQLKLRRNVATEQAQVVCRALAELLPSAGVQRLTKHLPELASLFIVPSRPQPVAHPAHAGAAAGGEPTLARARPASEHPSSEATRANGGGFGTAELKRAHSQSVARALEPHADTKLSSARGLTQEREGSSLATARRDGRA